MKSIELGRMYLMLEPTKGATAELVRTLVRPSDSFVL